MKASTYKQRKTEIEAKEFRHKFRKLQNDLGKLYGVLWDQCDSGMKNKIQSDLVYPAASDMLDVIVLLIIVEQIYLSKDSSKSCAEEIVQFQTSQRNTIRRQP